MKRTRIARLLGPLFDALKCASVHSVRLAIRDRQLARQYCSQCIQRYNELMGYGLAARNPLRFIDEQGWSVRAPDERVELPIHIHTGGGVRLDELLVLAMVARVLQPSKIFEIGTFMGRTTSVLMVNAPPGASVVTLDLPLGAALEEVTVAGAVDTDAILVQRRNVGALLRQLGLDRHCEQILCDSLRFDPTSHRNSVELGFIDGAHSLQHVDNDTRKMAIMMSERGLVFWHDYGGGGRFRELTMYLEKLATQIAIYRVPNTTLAWAPAFEVCKLAR